MAWKKGEEYQNGKRREEMERVSEWKMTLVAERGQKTFQMPKEREPD